MRARASVFYGGLLLGIVAGMFIICAFNAMAPGDLRPEDRVAVAGSIKCQ